MHRLSEELVKQRKKVIISAATFPKLPVQGELFVSQNMEILLKLLQRELTTPSIIYAGKGIAGNSVNGFELDDLEFLKSHLPPDYVLLFDASDGESRGLCAREQVKTWVNHHAWHQLIYYFDISQIDHPLDKPLKSSLGTIRKKYGNTDTLTQEIFIEYLTNTRAGVGAMFRQPWPVLLFIGDVNETRRENRAIQLSRELQQKGVAHIWGGDLNSLSIRKLSV